MKISKVEFWRHEFEGEVFQRNPFRLNVYDHRHGRIFGGWYPTLKKAEKALRGFISMHPDVVFPTCEYHKSCFTTNVY